jgi:hypothetical protein
LAVSAQCRGIEVGQPGRKSLVLDDVTDNDNCCIWLGSTAGCAVLSDDERNQLLDVEHRLMADDPEFALSFQEQLRQRPALEPQTGSNSKIAVAVALVFSAILLLAGFTSGAVACVVTTGLVWAMWRYSNGPTTEQPDSAQ